MTGAAEGPCGRRIRIVQIHPTRRCNLRCLHCYSRSGPEQRQELSFAVLREAVTDASSEGYTVASISGGEPLLYEPLAELLAHAKTRGLFTTITTNGMLLDTRRMSRLAGVTDLLAISLDGTPASHNRMRASSRAFDQMASRLGGVRRNGIPFGFIFTLTRSNLDELQWVADFALSQGASLLQIHPLEECGRAVDSLLGASPDEATAAYAFLAVARLKERMGDRLYVQLDFCDRDVIRAEPERVFAEDGHGDAHPLLSEIVSPLVIEPDGTVVPLQYGFARRYAFGNLADAPLRDLARRWMSESSSVFRDLCSRTFREVTAPEHELPFFNWYEVVARG